MLNTSIRWSQAALNAEQKGEAYVLATLLESAGSTPRIAGTKMVITACEQFDTLGGGHLEYAVIDKARDLLKGALAQPYIHHFPLGATLGQCCGGSVSVLFELLHPVKLHLTLFGAGHIAQQIVELLEPLPVAVRWIDNREGLFPESTKAITLLTDDPVGEVVTAPRDSAFLVLTHNHQLDFDLAKTVLAQRPQAFLGVIGSVTKAARFRHKLVLMGISEKALGNLRCPVGLADVTGKLPMEVAISIVGQLISLYQPAADTQPKKARRVGISKQALKPFMQPVGVPKHDAPH